MLARTFASRNTVHIVPRLLYCATVISFRIHSAIVDPVVAAFKDYIDAIDNVYAKAQCQRASEIATRVMTLPMRLIALKLGIGQEAHR